MVAALASVEIAGELDGSRYVTVVQCSGTVKAPSPITLLKPGTPLTVHGGGSSSAVLRLLRKPTAYKTVYTCRVIVKEKVPTKPKKTVKKTRPKHTTINTGFGGLAPRVSLHHPAGLPGRGAGRSRAGARCPAGSGLAKAAHWDNGRMTEPQQATPTQSAPSPAAPSAAAPSQASTAWTASGKTPLRQFLRTETGSATILGGATLAALIWSNVAPGSYDAFWGTALTARVAGHGIAMTLREFVNSGLMALFFLVVGLEARREWDMGELRVRSRLALPLLAGLGGMIVPIAIYLAFNAAGPTAHGWGAAMSTDTAFALGALALAGGKRLPDRVRTYLLTFSVVDDLLGLAVIAVFYSSHVRWLPLLIGIALLAADAIMSRRGIRNGPVYVVIGLGAWLAFWESGVDPIVSGLVIGLVTCAYPAAREDLQQATDAFRLFREQPTARLAAEAREVVRGAISPNERLQERYHGWTSYLIVPLFALANADIKISGSFLAHAYTSTATLGIMVGYIVGKPVGTAGAAWLVSKFTKKRLTPPVGWGAVAGVGAVAGIGFTVSLLIVSLAFTGTELAEAKLGILSGAICATLLTWLIFGVLNRLSPRTRLRALLGTATSLTDLAVPVDPERDHVRGPGVLQLLQEGRASARPNRPRAGL